MLGRSLPLPRFFFVFSAVDAMVHLEVVLIEEPTSVILDLFLCGLSWEFNSIRLKYSISCIMSDATVPRVPISTGGNPAISFGSRVVGLCMLSVAGVEEKANSSDLRRVVCGFVLMGKLQRDSGILFCFKRFCFKEFFTLSDCMA